jgi:hypothetical protein
MILQRRERTLKTQRYLARIHELAGRTKDRRTNDNCSLQEAAWRVLSGIGVTDKAERKAMHRDICAELGKEGGEKTAAKLALKKEKAERKRQLRLEQERMQPALPF